MGRDILPWPFHSLPWGITEAFYRLDADLFEQSGPVISTWGGKKVLKIRKTKPLLILYQVIDAENGKEIHEKVNTSSMYLGFIHK